MPKLTPHEKLDEKLDGYKTQLIHLKDMLDKSSESLKSDLEADINDIEKMLKNVKKHMSQLGYVAEDEWHVVESNFKGCWNDISRSIKNAVYKSSNT